MDLRELLSKRSSEGRIRLLKDIDGRYAFVDDEGVVEKPSGSMEFVATITTRTKDRDGDVLEPAGAVVDANAPLLWQHDPQKPIGRVVSTTKSPDKLSGTFVLADTELARDAAKLLEVGALRISHGFVPLELEPLNDAKSPSGFHVKRFEVVEVSLVSIPSNPEAVVQTMRQRSITLESVEAKSFVESLVTKSQGKSTMPTITPDTLFNSSVASVKASARYSSKRYTGKHDRTHQEVAFKGRSVEIPSELDRAKTGVWLRSMALKQGASIRPLDDHERALLEELLEEPWIGVLGGSNDVKRFEGPQVKALLNDGTSGGAELVPEFFDTSIVTFPLLSGELLPLVTIRDVPRSDQVEGASIDNPTVTWNTAEGTEMGLFNTSSLVSEINTSIHNVHCALEVGRDFLSDSAVTVGDVILQNVSNRMSEELDKVIAIGNGTTQPEGIFNASGTTSVASISGTSGPLMIADAENLMFGLAKQYRTPARRPVFVGADATYRRFRATRVGTSDARRVFGMDHSSYTLMEHAFKVQNDIPSNQVGFVAMERYRLYRRQGQEVRWEMGGKELARKNLALLIVRGRFGGRLVDGNAAAIMNDAAIENDGIIG